MMVRWKRFTSGFLSSIDGFIAQVENHEAQATSALRELEQGVGRAKVQLARVGRDGAALRQSFSEEQEGAVRWRERAKRESNETRALECLRRAKRSETRSIELNGQVAEHDRIEQQLKRDVQTLETKLVELRQQRNTMRTRQSRAEALVIVQGSGAVNSSEIGDIFERWEERVAESEVASGCVAVTADSLDEELTSAEEEAALKLELEALRRESEEVAS
ncbi:MAG TPA: PspA/IM30 family protein [Polyangiaceae bacterium]|jgi:phage shock protein A|nr:PspA/IM30 family protein [Polyangiaceae bacterium]